MKNLILITDCYPFGQGEKFLDDEINYLATRFKEIYIVPTIVDGELTRTIPNNCKIWQQRGRVNIIESLYWGGMCAKSLVKDWNSRPGLILFAKKLVRFFLLSKEKTSTLSLLMKQLSDGEFIVYHYWKNESLLWTARATQKLGLFPTIVSRAHRYDLYIESALILLRADVGRVAQKIYPVSMNGARHLIDDLGHDAEQVTVRRLGVSVPVEENPLPNRERLSILSLSFLNNVKRIELLIESLMKAQLLIEWHVIGSGPLEEEIKAKAKLLPENVIVRFYGYLEPEEITVFFKETPIHFLVNLSSSEGVPVSMMEALSFGIPIIATAVGGVSEIVEKNAGLLLSADPKSVEVLQNLIAGFEEYDYKGIRSQCKQIATEKWNAEFNYSEFADEIHVLKKELR